MLACGPVPGRVLLVQFAGPLSDREAPITAEELTRSLRHVSGADVTVLSFKTATRFTDNARQATSYRSGRVLLAGDAAHVHSPFGGQGLNLGLLDAVNLGWKLAATVRGWAPSNLLDSYTQERHPVAARVLENTRAQVALMRPDALTSALRQVVTDVMLTDDGNRFFGEMISGLRTRYELGGDAAEVGTLTANRAVEDGTLFDNMRTSWTRGMKSDESLSRVGRRGCAACVGNGRCWCDRTGALRGRGMGRIRGRWSTRSSGGVGQRKSELLARFLALDHSRGLLPEVFPVRRSANFDRTGE